MNLDTRGFADGFLNGFRTMADYQSQQKADARADKSLSLQEQQIKDGNDQWKQSFDHTVNQDNITNTREDRRLTNQEKDADRNYFLNEKQTLASVAASKASAAASRVRTEAEQYSLNRQKNIDWVDENTPRYLTITGRISRGEKVSDDDFSFIQDEKWGAMSAKNFIDTSKRNATIALSGKLKNITANAGKMSLPEINKQLNTPEMVSLFGEALHSDVNKNANYFDSLVGKQVVGKKFAGLYAIKNDKGQIGIVGETKLQYEDGTESEARPITEGRSSDPKDKVLFLDAAEVQGAIQARANLYSKIDPSYINEYLQNKKLKDRPDIKGFVEKAADIDNKTQSSLATAMRAYQSGTGTDGANIEKRLSEIKQQGENAKRALARGYGLSDVAYNQLMGDKGAGEDASKQNQLAVSQWVGNDPGKQAFIASSIQSGHFDPNSGSTTDLDSAYKQYQVELKNQSLENAAKSAQVKKQ